MEELHHLYSPVLVSSYTTITTYLLTHLLILTHLPRYTYITHTMMLRNAIIGELSGYLYKKTRDGRWQRRFFETHSVYLTYYKSKKKQKILAALGLAQVGEIKSIAGKCIA